MFSQRPFFSTSASADAHRSQIAVGLSLSIVGLRKYKLVMSYIMGLRPTEQDELVVLLHTLTSSKSPIFQTLIQTSTSSITQCQDLTRLEFWRLWTIVNGPPPFLRVWDGGVITNGSVLQEIVNSYLPHDSCGDLCTLIPRVLEAWYALSRVIHHMVQRDLDKAAVTDTFFDDLVSVLNVAKW
jgi:hypothetical protein